MLYPNLFEPNVWKNIRFYLEVRYSNLIIVINDNPTFKNLRERKRSSPTYPPSLSFSLVFSTPTDESSFFKIPQQLELFRRRTAGGRGGRVRLRRHHCRAFMRSHMRRRSNRRSSLRLASPELRGRGAVVGDASGGEQGLEEEDRSVASEGDPRRHCEL